MKTQDKVAVYNPLNENFSVGYDMSGGGQIYTIPSKEVAHFPEVIAKHIKKHLANRIFDLRGDTNKNRGPQIEKIMEEISL